MAFSLNPDKSLADEFQRVALEGLDEAVEGLNAKDIHLGRSRLKRVRALLKLAGIEEDATAAGQERALRDAGRILSEARDIEVCLKTLAEMQQKQSPRKKSLPAGLFEKACADLKRDFCEIDVDKAIAEAREEIVAARGVLSQWHPDTDWKSVRCALCSDYRRSRRALKKACDSKGSGQEGYAPTAMHRLRKRLKTLWLQLRLLCECWPKVVKEVACEAERLSDLLGKGHDLVILQDRLNRAGADPSLDALREKIASQRARLDRDCLSLADRFLEEKPREFVERIFALSKEAKAQ